MWCVEDVDELEQVKIVLKAMVNEEDTKILARQSRDGVGSVGLATAAGATSFRTSRLDREIDSYVQAMINRGEQACNALNTLEFWPNEGKRQWPTLCYLAALILPTPLASASVEQVFSISGRVACEARASLNSRHVNELVCLHQWLVDAGMVSKESVGRSEKRTKDTRKFAYLNLRREVEGPDHDEGSDDEESDGEDE